MDAALDTKTGARSPSIPPAYNALSRSRAMLADGCCLPLTRREISALSQGTIRASALPLTSRSAIRARRASAKSIRVHHSRDDGQC